MHMLGYFVPYTMHVVHCPLFRLPHPRTAYMSTLEH